MTKMMINENMRNDNLLCVIATDADEYVQSMNVPFEKAIEIVVKNEYLEGRWF